MSTPAYDGSLYARLGGGDAIQAVTADFYGAVLADPSLAPHFSGVDMARQENMLASFLTLAFEGPSNYTGRTLRTAHADLAIGDAEFDAVVAYLAAALKAAGVSDGAITEVAGVAETVRADVLGR